MHNRGGKTLLRPRREALSPGGEAGRAPLLSWGDRRPRAQAASAPSAEEEPACTDTGRAGDSSLSPQVNMAAGMGGRPVIGQCLSQW